MIIGRCARAKRWFTSSAATAARRPRGGAATRPVVSRATHTMAGDGRFLVCHVPRDQPIQIAVDGAEVSTTTRLARDQLLAIVALSLPR